MEWSKDGNSWTNIGNVAAAGFSGTPKSYGLLHPNPVSGANYYRLRSVDIGGQFTYSSIKVVIFGDKTGIKVLPNPVVDQLYITGGSTTFQAVTLYTAEGKLLQQHEKFSSGASIKLGQYPAGMYLLKITDAQGNTEVHSVIKGKL